MSIKETVKAHKGKILLVGVGILTAIVNFLAGDPVGPALNDILSGFFSSGALPQ